MAQTDNASSPMYKTNLAFAAMLIGMVGYFIYWGLDYTHQHHQVMFLLATLFGVFMAFNIGGNDVANSFGTSVGAGTLTIPQALLVAAVFEVSGAVIAGGAVTETIRNGIVNMQAIPMQPMQFVYVMMSALLSAALWLLFASRRGLPVSTTHAIIGGIVGSSMLLGYLLTGNGDGTLALVQWDRIGGIAVSWVLSPVLGGLMSYVLFGQVKKYVLDYNERVERDLKALKAEKKAYKEEHRLRMESLTEIERLKENEASTRDAEIYDKPDFDPEDLESGYYKGLYNIDKRKNQIDAYKALQHWVPAIAAGGGMVIAAMLIFKGLKNLNLGLGEIASYLTILMIGAAIWLATFIYAKNLKRKDLAKSTFLIFSWMQVFTAAGFAFSHGANDISNAIGPFAAIMDVLRTGSIGEAAPIPPVVLLTFGIALVVGLWFIGKEVIATVGTGLAKMHPSSGFTAELSAATVVMAASLFGLPVSSTHILVGAVLGIGLVNRNANWQAMKPIALAWVVTLPAASVLSIVCFFCLRAVFG
ncbi:MAG: anion permease [Neisseria sp.]|nr:anion permease [Neisseria sp.]